LTRAIQRFPRHLGIHVGGMVITEAPLSQVVPIENASMPGRTVIQWDKDDVSDCGLVKIDLLGLGMLSMISRAIRLVKEHHGVTLDPALLTYDDPAVYDLLSAADTVGVFQVESRAQMATLPRLKPRCFYDLVVEVALIRPGPIQGDMVHPYLRRRAGEEPVTYPHPCLEPVLKRTLGIPLFQEQGMRVAIAAAGFTPGEADQLRRAMGHKRSRERMEALAAKLITGMVANGIAAETARNIYRQLAAFADYGFPESHAASFALLVYVSAHLKRYWPAEFTCALLNAQPMGFYSPATLLEDARRHGVEVRPIDLARSRWECTLETGGGPASAERPRTPLLLAVRLGLRYVKGLGESAREQLEKALPFCSLEEVVERGGLPSAVLERLAAIGAFAGFGLQRRQALWRLHELLARPPGLPRRAAARPAPEQAPLPEMTAVESMVADYRSTGLTTGPHPMTFLRAGLARKRVLTAARLQDCPDGRRVRVAGLVIARQRPPTAGGFLFMTLEDETGLANIVVKPWLVEREGPVVCRAAVLLVEGTMQEEKAVRNVVAGRVEELEFPDPRVEFRSRDFR
jgi:error-prone DNA polymerase